jgi:hypothetical protein
VNGHKMEILCCWGAVGTSVVSVGSVYLALLCFLNLNSYTPHIYVKRLYYSFPNYYKLSTDPELDSHSSLQSSHPHNSPSAP